VVRLRPATWHTVNIRNQAVPNMDTEGLEVTIEALNLLEPRCALVPDKSGKATSAPWSPQTVDGRLSLLEEAVQPMSRRHSRDFTTQVGIQPRFLDQRDVGVP